MPSHQIVSSPNAPRPADPLVLWISDMLMRIERNYGRETSGPGSRFEGRLLEDVQAEAVVRCIREKLAQQVKQQKSLRSSSFYADLLRAAEVST